MLYFCFSGYRCTVATEVCKRINTVPRATPWVSMRVLKEALLYRKSEKCKVSCFLCSHHCQIEDGASGICRVRQNNGGTLYTLVYGEVIAAHVDPVEKKPIFHVAPGSKSFSIATCGCNLRCVFCQNWQISQQQEAELAGVNPQALSPEEVVREAVKFKCRSISYTYTEPTIFFEYALDISRLAKKSGLYNIFVTNGFMTKEALEMIRPYLDAANVDLKFFTDESYQKFCGARLAPVLNTIRLMRKLNIWVEVTTLVIPGLNDSSVELKGIASFLADAGKEIPWHISRFHPDYKYADSKPTPVNKLREAFKIGKEAGLRYVYIGNVSGQEKTCCYSCGKVLILRSGYDVFENSLRESRCPECGAEIEGVGL